MPHNTKWPTPFLAEKLKEIKPCPSLIKYKIVNGEKQQNIRYFERKIIERIVKDGASWWIPITQNMGEYQLQRMSKWSFISFLYGLPQPLRDRDMSPEELLWTVTRKSFLSANTPPQKEQIKELQLFLKALDRFVSRCPVVGLSELRIEVEFQLLNRQHHAFICQKGQNQLRDAFIRLINNALRCSRDNNKIYDWKFALISQIARLSSTVLGQKIDQECIASILSRYRTSQKLDNYLRSTGISPLP